MCGTMSCGELCQPAPSRISRAMALTLDALADFGPVFDADCGHDQGGPCRRAGQMAPNRWSKLNRRSARDPRTRCRVWPDAGQRACWPTRASS